MSERMSHVEGAEKEPESPEIVEVVLTGEDIRKGKDAPARELSYAEWDELRKHPERWEKFIAVEYDAQGVRLYHATIEERLEPIANEGVRAGKDSLNTGDIMQDFYSTVDHAYFCASFGDALSLALWLSRKARGYHEMNDPVVVEVRADKDDLEADPDRKGSLRVGAEHQTRLKKIYRIIPPYPVR